MHIPYSILVDLILPEVIHTDFYRSFDHVKRDAFSMLLVARSGSFRQLAEMIFESWEPGCVIASGGYSSTRWFTLPPLTRSQTRYKEPRQHITRLVTRSPLACPLSPMFLKRHGKLSVVSKRNARFTFLLPHMVVNDLQFKYGMSRIPKWVVLDEALKTYGPDVSIYDTSRAVHILANVEIQYFMDHVVNKEEGTCLQTKIALSELRCIASPIAWNAEITYEDIHRRLSYVIFAYDVYCRSAADVVRFFGCTFLRETQSIIVQLFLSRE
jgi:hypothetical protein